MQYSHHQLVLFPVQADSAAIAAMQLERCLRGVNLLGEALGGGRYAVGEAFLSLLCFLGCSPDIELTPHADKPFCYVQLPQDDALVEFNCIRKPLIKVGTWVIIGNIHEAEAVPDAALLSALEAASGCRWKYAYRR
jgi:hypothetical protein